MPIQDPPVQGAYQRLSNEEIEEILKEFMIIIRDFFRGLEYPNDVEYTVFGIDLIDAIFRVDKRTHYFQIFHGMTCNEGKKAALYAYWIAKLRPIKITDDRYKNIDGYNNQINELFAIHYMLSALCGMGRIKLWDGHNGVELSLDNPFIKRLRYSMRFRNITIDSIIVLADTITTETFNISAQDVLP